ncbi:hypothetical protein FOS14_22170 [Skermania sp. ID1734]|uniref:hypothetical protein n=1 Tax=Skermania sp. ID1734 TaxID=2597516 RepID=UPI00117CC891|nr:hypothetical protein [Skermania sp. ID1734]TSD93771.1 hypothetical protein FOS14_22170 [Skermania sp. ID1734]
MGSKAERRAARDLVAAYHQRCLGELLEHVAAAIDRYRVGELDAFEVDQEIHHYHRAAQRLWSFCQQTGAHAESTAHLIEDMARTGDTIDWWQRAQPQPRDHP